jgi:serine/threonine-protein kinase HipA
MAREAGIDMPDMDLLEERRLAHLMVKRFDRVGDKRIHMHSLGGMEHADYNEPRTCSYEQYFRVVLRLKLGYKELERAYRRAVFNVLAVNQDDHVKNLSFLMERSGQWRLSPGYDLTYAKGAGFTREHQMTLAGKTDGFTMDDLLNVGSQFDIDRNGAGVIEEVSKALTHWPKWAAEVGVPADRIRQIGGDFRLKAVKGSPLATRGKRPRGDKQSRRLTTT